MRDNYYPISTLSQQWARERQNLLPTLIRKFRHPESARGGKWIQFPPGSFHMQILTTHTRADYMYGFQQLALQYRIGFEMKVCNLVPGTEK